MIPVHVERSDIESGKRGKCNECPVAKALIRAIEAQYGAGRLIVISVGACWLQIKLDKNWDELYVYRTPLLAAKFILAFDGTWDTPVDVRDRRTLDPFTFHVPELDQWSCYSTAIPKAS